MSEDQKTNKSVSIHQRQFAGEGDFIIKQGDKGDIAYLIQSGKVRVYAEHNGKQTELAELGAGEIFGEMALVIDEPRAANVIALENCNLITITRPMMIEKMATSDVTIKALMKMMIKRLKEANNHALNKEDGFEDLINISHAMYENIENKLDAKQKSSLQRSVKPQMDAFIKAISEFQNLYKDD